MHKCNLDPLVENYDISFYNHYLATWPKLFIVIADENEDIIAYGGSRFLILSHHENFCYTKTVSSALPTNAIGARTCTIMST